MEDNLYYYKAHVIKVYDGDTITVNVDLGFGVWMTKQKIRLARINTPEIKGEEREQGLISANWLREKILDKDVLLHTQKDSKGKYGRWLADIIWNDTTLNDLLVENGLAEYKQY